MLGCCERGRGTRSRVNFHDFDFERVEVEYGDGATVGDPAAAFAGVKEEFTVTLFVDDFVGVAGNDDVSGSYIVWFEPLQVVVHDDGFAGEFHFQWAVYDIGEDFLETLAFAVVVAEDAVEGDGKDVGGDEFGGEGGDVVAGVEDGLAVETFEQGDGALEGWQSIMGIADDSDFHNYSMAEKGGLTQVWFTAGLIGK
jgi:hypothetical protein